MGIIVSNMFLSLDGVYQGPGGPEEDTEGGFAFGGWQVPFSDDGSDASISRSIDSLDALLLGRRTYDIFAAYWPDKEDSVGVKFNAVPKFVVSRTLDGAAWEGTTVLRDAASVARLRERFDEVHLFGSGELVRALLAENTLDRLQLWQYPVILGQGKRLLDTGTIPTALRLVQPARSFERGAVELVYERAGAVETGTMAD